MGCGGSKSAEFSSIESASAPSSTPLKTPVKATKSESPISVLTPEQQETKKLKAVLKMQAASRGKFAREKAKNLKEPCVHFLINIRADRDNECMCGWLKSEHKEEAMINARRGSKWELLKNATLINSNELRSRFVQKTKAACEKYEVNMQSINFGECICGLPRGEHSALALLAGGIKKDAGMGQVESAELRGRFVQKMYAPCTKYVVDMGASAVGMCVCGEPRANHSPSALKASVAEKTVVKIDAEQVRKSFVQKEKVGCAKYEVNLEGQTLGECKHCGFGKADHTEEAQREAVAEKTVAKIDSEEVRRRFSQREIIACDMFDIDMITPDVPFGTCVNCGQLKAKHSEDVIKASKPTNTRASAIARSSFSR